jgi:hypothetical protein
VDHLGEEYSYDNAQSSASALSLGASGVIAWHRCRVLRRRAFGVHANTLARRLSRRISCSSDCLSHTTAIESIALTRVGLPKLGKVAYAADEANLSENKL